jgi:hypothetical protein
MQSTVTAHIPLDSAGEKRSARQLPRSIGRIQSLFRCGGMAAASLFTCARMLLSRHPRTPLRVLCIGALEYLARVNGQRLDSTTRLSLAYACDFGALLNDYYDRGQLDRSLYRKLRCGLRRLSLKTSTHRYIRELRKAERGRPSFGPEGFAESGAVVEYRIRVVVLSLTWLQVLSHQLIGPRLFQALVALVGMVQLADDLVDWKEDWACRRPTYVTAFLGDRTTSREPMSMHIELQANRLRGQLMAAYECELKVAPLMLAGFLTWLLVMVLTKIRFPR